MPVVPAHIVVRRSAARSAGGEINILLLPLVAAVILFVVAISFGVWAYGSREDYRKNTQAKVDAAVKVAVQQESVIKDKEHAEADKQPLKTYSGPLQFGSVQISYPKTWSAYVDSTSNEQPLDGYFQPDVVPSVTDDNSSFALRMRILNQSYATTLDQYTDAISSGAITASSYAFPKVPKIVGVRLVGNFESQDKFSGTMIMVPLRDKTLEIWNEVPANANDFQNLVLPNVTFSP